MANPGFHPSEADMRSIEAQRAHLDNAPNSTNQPAPTEQPSIAPAGHYSTWSPEDMAAARDENYIEREKTYHPPTPTDEEAARIRAALSVPAKSDAVPPPASIKNQVNDMHDQAVADREQSQADWEEFQRQ